MNIIFLDIDGVLNSNFWNDRHQKEISDGTLIELEKVKLLGKLVKETSARVILHSGWKYWFDENSNPLRQEAARLKELLNQADVIIDGITPDLASEEIKRTKKFSLVKADEILLWLEKHPGNNWVVIDDLDLHNNVIAKQQVMTDAEIGLTVNDIEKVKALFDEQESLSF